MVSYCTCSWTAIIWLIKLSHKSKQWGHLCTSLLKTNFCTESRILPRHLLACAQSWCYQVTTRNCMERGDWRRLERVCLANLRRLSAVLHCISTDLFHGRVKAGWITLSITLNWRNRLSETWGFRRGVFQVFALPGFYSVFVSSC